MDAAAIKNLPVQGRFCFFEMPRPSSQPCGMVREAGLGEALPDPVGYIHESHKGQADDHDCGPE